MLEKDFQNHSKDNYASMNTPAKTPFLEKLQIQFRQGGKLRPFRPLKQDISNIRKRYISDWTLFNQLIFASAVYVLFTNILPGITFPIPPLTILGVTGPFAVLAEIIYELCEGSFHVDFLSLMAWSLIYAAWMHYLLAIFKAHA
ncbi:uncharacterized protein RSE6_11663 [Rhynchosporium secalis]|uniref:Uncharacterized protein n=1 Tax=Rhynchosporium secalis TaxID=38038 RepID=A0A1E1MNJ1_RHYSE|nr:uncharacterized protein RSE6_11663 [Rhynchosporium secalis]